DRNRRRRRPCAPGGTPRRRRSPPPRRARRRRAGSAGRGGGGGCGSSGTRGRRAGGGSREGQFFSEGEAVGEDFDRGQVELLDAKRGFADFFIETSLHHAADRRGVVEGGVFFMVDGDHPDQFIGELGRVRGRRGRRRTVAPVAQFTGEGG